MPGSPAEVHPRKRRIPDAFDTQHDNDSVLEVVAQRLGFLERIRQHPILGWVYRIAVGLVGGLVVVIGLILVPLPGPGWLIVFAGLGILASEFAWAQKLLAWVKSQVLRWLRWVQQQPLWLRLIVGSVGLLAIIAIVACGIYASGWAIPPFD